MQLQVYIIGGDTMSNESDDRTLLSFEEQHGREAEIALIGALSPRARELATIIGASIEGVNDIRSDAEFDAFCESCGCGEWEIEDSEKNRELVFQICCADLHNGKIDIGLYSRDQAVKIFGKLVTQMVLLEAKIIGARFVAERGWCQYDHPEVGRKHEKIFIVTFIL